MALLSKPINCKHEPLGFLERVLFWRYFQLYGWIPENCRRRLRFTANSSHLLRGWLKGARPGP
jgi:hypothetical protein